MSDLPPVPLPPVPLPLDTGVLIAVSAATGSWAVLEVLAQPFVITPTVLDEVRGGPAGSPGTATPLAANMTVWNEEPEIPRQLLDVLDRGEASVIALALTRHWPEVGIDESMGRSVAKASGLKPVGSLGLLIKAKRKGYPITIARAIGGIRAGGIWIGADVEQAALRIAGEL